MEEVITVRPKEGNPNFEEYFVAAPTDNDNADEYGFHRDARIGVNVPGLSLDNAEDPFQLQPPPNNNGLSPEALEHLNRKVKTLTDPVLMFVAEVAASTGSSLSQMMINPSLPLVNTEAPSINALLSSSQFPRDLLLVLLARLLLDKPTLSVAPPPATAAPATAKQDPLADLSNTPNGTPTKLSNAPIGDTIREYVETLAPVGVNPFARQPQPQTAEEALYQALLGMQGNSEVLDWTWSQMPEQSGLAIVRPEVTSVIQSCFEEVRALSESHRRIKLWHLITGPLVRHKFARLVGSLLNTTPGEMQYPGFSSVRRNGAVTGSRVTPGITVQAQHSRIYVKLLSWFKHVSYREAEEWVQVNQRLEGSSQAIRMALKELDQARKETIAAARVIWSRLVPDARERAADLWFFEKMYPAASGARPVALIDQFRTALATGSPKGSIGAAAGSDIYFLAPLAGPIPPPVRVFVASSSPRSARAQRDQSIELPDNNEPQTLASILTAALTALERFGPRLQSPDDMDAVFTLSLKIRIMMAALTGVKRVIDQSFADRKLAASFDEMRRMELVHRAPPPSRDRPPLRNFLY